MTATSVQPGTVLLDNDVATAVSLEGRSWTAPIHEALELAHVKQENEYLAMLGQTVLPDGVRGYMLDGVMLYVAIQRRPGVYYTHWPPKNATRYTTSPSGAHGYYTAPFALAMPYVLVVASIYMFRNRPYFREQTQVYFTNKPLESFDDVVCEPALLNTQGNRYHNPYRPIKDTESFDYVGLCHVSSRGFQYPDSKSPDATVRDAIDAARGVVFDSAFTPSLQLPYTCYERARKLDRRLDSPEAWAEASRVDSKFVLSIPWRKVSSLRDACRAVTDASKLGQFRNNAVPRTALEVANMVFRASRVKCKN